MPEAIACLAEGALMMEAVSIPESARSQRQSSSKCSFCCFLFLAYKKSWKENKIVLFLLRVLKVPIRV
jgi:hypothetical protein